MKKGQIIELSFTPDVFFSQIFFDNILLDTKLNLDD